MPSKSAIAGAVFLAATSACTAIFSDEFAPKTVRTAPKMFSSSMVEIDTAPTLLPARLQGTHGAGAFFPSLVIMKKVGSVVALTISVQYWNEAAKPSKLALPGGVNHPKAFAIGWPCLSG